MMILLLALALVGVGAMTRAEAKAERQLRRAKKLQKKARARDSLVRDSPQRQTNLTARPASRRRARSCRSSSMYDEAQQREIMLDGIETSGAVQMSQCVQDYLDRAPCCGGMPMALHVCNEL